MNTISTRDGTDQGLRQVLQAAVSGLAPKTAYVLALADIP
jgi:hypothetical protein